MVSSIEILTTWVKFQDFWEYIFHINLTRPGNILATVMYSITIVTRAASQMLVHLVLLYEVYLSTHYHPYELS
jgi:hypothetical protein